MMACRSLTLTAGRLTINRLAGQFADRCCVGIGGVSSNHLQAKGNFQVQNLSTQLNRKPFKDAKEEEDIVSVPLNLKIDSRATCSPFYGLNKVKVEIDPALKSDDEHDQNNHQEGTEMIEENDDENIYYSLSPTALTEPTYAVPLPQRLHVPIYSLYPDDNDNDHKNTADSLEQLGTLHLSPSVFGMDPIRTDILHRVIVYQRNKKRGKRFPAKSKTISEVSGSGKKMRPQKGGGTARAGHKRPAHWRGGAKAHGPKGKVQDYTTKLNKKVRALGMRHALSQKLKEGNLVLVNDMTATTTTASSSDGRHKTNSLVRALRRFEIGGKTVDVGATALLVDDADKTKEETVSGVDASLKLAGRNIFKVKLMNQLGANVHDIMKREKLVLSLSALEALEKRLG